MSEHPTDEIDMTLLLTERRVANAARGELLQLITDGTVTPWEAIVAAAASGEKPLLRLRLDQIITAGPGIGAARARAVIAQVLHILEATESRTANGHVTLAYILDEQARGRRLLAVLDAFISYGLIQQAQDLTVWPGFPFAAAPLPREDAR